jgi:hypothetical protein
MSCQTVVNLDKEHTIINSQDLQCAGNVGDILLLSSVLFPIDINTVKTGSTDESDVTFYISIGSYSFNANGKIFSFIINFPQITEVNNPNNLDVFKDEAQWWLYRAVALVKYAHRFGVTINGIIYSFRTPDGNYPDWNYEVKIERDPNSKVSHNSTTPQANQANQSIKDNLGPMINIIARYLIDFSDIGNTFFELTEGNDTKKYDLSCVKIVTVLRGKGNTANEKMGSLYIKDKITIRGITFSDNIVEYSIVKYFLSKLLYGNFNIKYLLRKYHDRFLRDLKNSKYSKFLDFFTIGELADYDKYFLFDFKHKES